MKHFKIFIIYSVMFFIGLAFICHSSTQKEAEPPNELIIRDYGFTALPMDGGMAFVSFAMEIENPNSELAACNESIRLTWRDEKGSMILSKEETLPVMMGGEVQGFSTNTTFSALPHSVSAELVTTDGFFIPAGQIDIQKPLKLTPVHFLMMSETPTISGEIINPNDLILHQALVTAVFRNREGKITGGASANVRQIQPAGNTPFAIFHEHQAGDQKIPASTHDFEGTIDLSIALWYQDLPLMIH